MPAKARAKHRLDPESVWFGARRVRRGEKTELVQEVFASVAPRYDLMNDLMSGGLHRLWKDRLVQLMNPKSGDVILDVAGGTGDIARRCWRRTRGKADITICDLSPAMIAAGRERLVDEGILSSIRFFTANAERLPIATGSIGIYCIAFGLRNVAHIDKALREAARVLKPGGRFYCLEFSSGVRPAIKPLYERYCLDVLPWMGALVAKDRSAYQYLAESIRAFPDQPALAKRIEATGLERVKWTNLTGGIAVIHSAWKL
jgi:demethylmenaquinone methyltransferase/2-methoxy-6-polyprenyl-1,4-benzoquinol methylase